MAARLTGALAAGLLAVTGACSSAEPAPPSGSPPTSVPAPAASRSTPGPWSAPGTSRLPGANASRLQAELSRWVAAGLVPGATAAVVTPEGAWSGAAGVDGRGAVLQPGAGMALASITKTFTAAEVMLLAERGALELDAAAATYLDIPQVANGVTVRQLLAQRSGVAESREAPLGDPDTAWSAEKYLSFVPRATARPGESFGYDNTNYVLLGLVIEQVTGRSLAAALTTDLWSPLGLDRLAYQDEQRLDPPLARPPTGVDSDPHVRGCDGAGPVLPCRALATVFGPAGAAAGDAETVARWGYQLYGSRVLRPESVAQMTDFADGDNYGLGTWDLGAAQNGRWGAQAVGHTGETLGYRTVLAVFPESRVSVAILTPSTVDVVPFVPYLVQAGALDHG